MLPRALEVLLVALLVMLTLGVAFEFQNHALLRDILDELRHRPATLGIAAAPQPAPVPAPAPPPVVETPPAPAQQPTQPVVVAPAPTPAPAPPQTPVAIADAGNGSGDRVAPKNLSSAPKPAPEPSPSPQPAPSLVVTAPAPAPAPQPGAPAAAPGDDEQWERVGPVMTQIIEDLLGGRYDDVVARFNSDMLATGLDRNLLAAAIEPLRQEHGGLKRIAYHNRPAGRLPANMVSYEIGVELNDSHPLLLTITLDSRQRISGLLMK